MKLILPVSKKTVELTPMRMKEERILTDKKLLKTGANIDCLLLSCMQSVDGEKPTEKQVLDLTSGDRNFLLYHLRILSYGEEFEIDETCPHCKKTTHYEFNLEEILENGTIEIRNEPECGLTKDVTLSDGETIVTVTAIDGHRERRLKTKKENITLNDITLVLLKAVNGEAVTAAATENFIGKDLRAIRKAAEELMCGLIPSIDVECEHCERMHELVITGSQSFFIR